MNFYNHAAQILDKLGRRQGTIKGLVIGDPKVRDKKKMYALVCETLKYKQVLNEIIDASGICTIEKKLTRSQALVLIHDLLFTKRGIVMPNTVPMKQCIQRHQARLKAELTKIKIKRNATSNEDLVSQKAKDAVLIPRYVRVNTLKMTVEEALKAFEKEGYTVVDVPENLSTLAPKTLCRDAHLNDLLVFAPKTDLHNHPLYVSGKIILQDKASCFPAHVCQAPPGAHAIDACAAPGNKTSHLSALMKNKGRIWAFDLDSRRLALLQRMTTKAGCKNINAVHGSFLEVDPNSPEYAKVEYFLLDPSCSGSGIISRLDHLVDDEEQEADDSEATQERLKNLSDFQISIIEHAFKFPSAKRVVYSTCSIHAMENEHVVRTILDRHPEFTLATRQTVLPTWGTRGILKECGGNKDTANAVVRADPTKDLTNGFFVACFVRKSDVPDEDGSAQSNAKASDKAEATVENGVSAKRPAEDDHTASQSQQTQKNKKRKKRAKKSSVTSS